MLPGVYIGNATVNSSSINPFQVVPVTPPISTSSGNGLPSISVCTDGIGANYYPWTIDF